MKNFCSILLSFVSLLFVYVFMRPDLDVPVPAFESTIFHERQQGRYCAVHAVNNLAQEHTSSVAEFERVAEELERAHKGVLDSSESSRQELRGVGGHYSADVLIKVLAIHGYSVRFFHAAGDDAPEVSEKLLEGFIVNRNDHWFAIKEIEGKYYNLDSTQPFPRVYRDQAHMLSAIESEIVLIITRET